MNEVVLRAKDNLPTPQVHSEEEIASAITKAYEHVAEEVHTVAKDVVRFGAFLAMAELNLKERGLLNRKSGYGMLYFLQETCPTVNYKTAMRWKDHAVRLSACLKCPGTPINSLKILAGEVEADEIDATVRERFDAIMAVKSMRGQCQMFFNFANDDAGKAGEELARQGVSPQKVDSIVAAQRMWLGPIGIFAHNRSAFYKSVDVLPFNFVEQVYKELEVLLKQLQPRIEKGQ